MDVTEQKPVVTGLEKPFVIGLDLGGTNAVFGVVDQAWSGTCHQFY